MTYYIFKVKIKYKHQRIQRIFKEKQNRSSSGYRILSKKSKMGKLEKIGKNFAKTLTIKGKIGKIKIIRINQDFKF